MSSPATFADVQAAARRLDGITLRTPLLENARVNDRLGGRLFIKAECLQRTGSFKLRGAYNFLASMPEADRKKGVVGWSSGNHAQGLAEAARLMGMKATIVMPADAPALKVANTRASGAEIVLHDRVKDSREEIGLAIAKKTGATVVPPYDHPWILTGQGTAGLEIVEQAQAAGVTLDATFDGILEPLQQFGFLKLVNRGVEGVLLISGLCQVRPTLTYCMLPSRHVRPRAWFTLA
jgi:threonine dehydratase